MTPAGGAGPLVRHRRRWGTPLIALLLMLSLVGCAETADQQGDVGPDSTYGSLPTFLPTAAFQPDSILIGTASRPALTTEGDTVKVQLPGGSVLATVTGPEVPGQGLPYQGPATTCTWRVTLTGASARLRISVDDFSSVDHLGTTYRPKLVPGTPAPPSEISPGQRVSFELRAVMRTGEGLMRWAPSADGAGKTGTILAAWDFEVEND